MNEKQENLVAGIKEGHRDVLKQFYKQNLPKILRYVEINSGNRAEAEDVFQDAMVLVYQKLNDPDFRLSASLETYTYAVAKNIWQSRLRRLKRMVLEEGNLDNEELLDTDILQKIEQNERYRIYQKCFEQLSEECQKVLTQFFDGVKMKDIARVMDYTESYVRKKKFECKTKLIELVKAEPSFDELAITDD